jgi:uncharacterized radical SAM superfamily Fe-S cluster-containing enzyme
MAKTLFHTTPDTSAAERQTLCGAPIEPLEVKLPRQTTSLCPECKQKLPARLFEENGGVYMEKTCPEHGYVKDKIFSDVEYYMKALAWHYDIGEGVSNPAVPNATSCPDDCGMCDLHVSHTVLANIDLTNRCNLKCPICFANANVQDYIYEPSFEEVKQMLQTLRDERPVHGRVVQFAGGEPTMHPDWFRILETANEMNFAHVQCATNGIKFADLDFTMRSKEAGLHTLYLQFDGVDPELDRDVRGTTKLLDIKLKAIENIRKAGLKIVYVPTIVGGINDHQVPKIFQFALDNIDVSSGISFQPVALTGRIDDKERERLRFTLSDLAEGVNSLGFSGKDDWFPLSCTSPVSQLISAWRGEKTCHITCHPHCGIGTYFFVDQNKKPTPITRFMDVKGMLDDMQSTANKMESARFKPMYKMFSSAKMLKDLKKHFKPEHAPEGLSFMKFMQTLEGLMDKDAGRGDNDGTYTYKTLLVAGMHFMDSYNYDIDRVKRCVIHYSAPDGRLYPFCAYNSGLVFREKIERQYSVPKSEFKPRSS